MIIKTGLEDKILKMFILKMELFIFLILIYF